MFQGSNYFPYRPDTNTDFDRDYKSFPEYETTALYEARKQFLTSNQSPVYLNYLRNMGTMTPSRKPPQMGLAATHHRRTHSNVSGISSNLSSIDSSHNDSDGLQSFDYHYNRLQQMTNRLELTPPKAPTNRIRTYDNVPFTRYNEIPTYNFMNTEAKSTNYDYQNTYNRPDSLPFDLSANSKLRSSLRKYSNSSVRSDIIGQASAPQTNPFTTTNQMQQGHISKISPTKTTPSDSLTSDDSSYLSAKEGSLSSQSRVRFSPDAVLDQSVAGSCLNGSIRRLSRSQRHSINDMLAPAASSPH